MTSRWPVLILAVLAPSCGASRPDAELPGPPSPQEASPQEASPRGGSAAERRTGAVAGAGDCPPRGDHALPDAGGYPGGAEVLWTGDGYCVLWYERPEQGGEFDLYFARLEPEGRLVEGSVRRVFDAEVGVSRAGVQAALGEGEIGIVFKRSRAERSAGEPSLGDVERQTTFARLDFAGRALGPERPLSPRHPWNGDHGAIAWDPSSREWGVSFESAQAFTGADRRLLFARLRPDGAIAGDVVLLESRPGLNGAGRSVVARPGGGFAVAFSDPEQLVLAEVIGEGVRRVPLFQSPSLGAPSIATDGREYAVATFGGPSPSHVSVIRVAVGGGPVAGSLHELGDSRAYSGAPDVRFTPEGLEVIWPESLPGASSRISRAVVTAEGPRSPTCLTGQDGSEDSHGRPHYVFGPCAGMLTYQSSGLGSELRLFVP